MAKAGSCRTIGSSHVTTSSPTSAATTVEAIGFDIDASWNTVSASTGSGLPRLPHAEAFDVDDLIAGDDRDRQAGHAGLPQRVAHQIVQLRQISLDPLARHCRRSLRPRQPRQQQAGPAEANAARRVSFMWRSAAMTYLGWFHLGMVPTIARQADIALIISPHRKLPPLHSRGEVAAPLGTAGEGNSRPPRCVEYPLTRSVLRPLGV